MVDVGGLPIQRIPIGAILAAHAWIMLEGEKRKIPQMIARLEVIHEAAQERHAAVGVRPGIHIAGRSFKGRPAQRRVGRQLVNRLGELYIECGVIFRQHPLAVRFLAHLDPRNWIFPFVEIRDFVGRIFGDRIENRNRNHGRKAARNTAVEEKIKSDLVAPSIIQVGSRVPRVH